MPPNDGDVAVDGSDLRDRARAGAGEEFLHRLAGFRRVAPADDLDVVFHAVEVGVRPPRVGTGEKAVDRPKITVELGPGNLAPEVGRPVDEVLGRAGLRFVRTVTEDAHCGVAFYERPSPL